MHLDHISCRSVRGARPILTFRVHPLGIEVWVDRLVADLLDRFRWLLVYYTARPPTSACLLTHGASPSRWC